MIHAKIVEGSFTTDLFYDFLLGLLNKMQPFPARNSVIVMDNARIHKNPRIVALIEARCVFVDCTQLNKLKSSLVACV